MCPSQMRLHKDFLTRSKEPFGFRVNEFQAWVNSVALDSLLRGTKDIPRVVGTVEFGGISFPSVGARRYVCLADGNSAVEQVVAFNKNTTSPIKCSLYASAGPSSRVRVWRVLYDSGRKRNSTEMALLIQPEEGSLPPEVGGHWGRFLFRRPFLNTKYAGFMNSAIDTIQSEAESANREGNQR